MHDDFKEFIESLKSAEVEFVVIGAHALAFHARPRYTEDLDIFFRRSAENRPRLSRALKDFGIPVTEAAMEVLFSTEKEMIVLGIEPNAIDLMNFLTGVSFDEAWAGRVEGNVVGVVAPIIGLAEYRKTKQAVGRAKDLADLALLKEILGE